MKKIGALEAGGTKMVAAILTEDGKILDRISIPTRSPNETLPELIRFYQAAGVAALGIGSFGPVDLKQGSPTYGHIRRTPKPGWPEYDLLGAFRMALEVPVFIDTDVNVAALGEYYYGEGGAFRKTATEPGMSATTRPTSPDIPAASAAGYSTSPDVLLYITIGTGIGIGVLVNGQPLHGAMHPEGGHILIRPRDGESFRGVCPYHENCFEGLASGPALKKKWGRPAAELQDVTEVWETESDYIAQALADYTLVLSPEKIILGGGVMKQTQLFPLIREKLLRYLNGYLDHAAIADPEKYVTPASLAGDQGILGCLALTQI